MNRFNAILVHYFQLTKLLIARGLACFCKADDTWLIAEKTNEARDNGYWFAKFMCTYHAERKICFVISEKSVDYSKIKELRSCKIVKPNSWSHKVLFWAAKYNVVSQPPCDYFSGLRKLLGLRRKKQINVFLQHGITKDDLDHSLDVEKSGIDIFITSVERERQAIMQRHNYSESQCVLTGLCRFDNLIRKSRQSRQILIMPTFRHWIMCSNKNGVPSEEEISRFKKDEFFRRYASLLKSPKLYKVLEQYNYQIIFYPHYCVQPFLETFKQEVDSNKVILASNKKYDVQTLLLEADILVTDYSSVFFDFAYLKKPEVFFQFDADRFREGHYQEGYFSYDKDGFGPVVSSEDEVISYISTLLVNDCRMEEAYCMRVKDFFRYIDQDNCRRTYGAIMDYDKNRNLKL